MIEFDLDGSVQTLTPAEFAQPETKARLNDGGFMVDGDFEVWAELVAKLDDDPAVHGMAVGVRKESQRWPEIVLMYSILNGSYHHNKTIVDANTTGESRFRSTLVGRPGVTEEFFEQKQYRGSFRRVIDMILERDPRISLLLPVLSFINKPQKIERSTT